MPPIAPDDRALLVRTLYAGKLLPDAVAATLRAGGTLFPSATVACGTTPGHLPAASRPLARVAGLGLVGLGVLDGHGHDLEADDAHGPAGHLLVVLDDELDVVEEEGARLA